MRLSWSLSISFFMMGHLVCGQISPPGLDDTNAAIWGAVGLNQTLSSKWSITIYAGASAESNPNNFKLLEKRAIMVFNQETLYKFNTHWQLAFCTSFRNQDRYEDEQPYTLSDPPLREELRYYMRVYYRQPIKKLLLVYSFRPELRSYYDHWHKWNPIPTELRFRFKITASYPLNASGSNQIIVGNEWLSATDHIHSDEHYHWSKYSYTEDRFTTYFRHTFKKPSLIFDAGIMHQIKSDGQYIPHLAIDFIFQNPFKR
jgi:hypothetical protein